MHHDESENQENKEALKRFKDRHKALKEHLGEFDKLESQHFHRGCKKFCVNGFGLLPWHPVVELNAKAV